MKLSNLLFTKSALKVASFQNYISTIIKHTGPITVHNFMREMLTHNDHGYYMHRNVFGEKGDFITSPEVSQMFGELIGVWIVNEWINQNKPTPFEIVELGPGRGALMNDALTAIAKFPDLFVNISIKFVEISPKLRNSQQELMGKCSSKLRRDVPVEWFASLDEVPVGWPSCFLAHEFFDVLPVHKFQRNNEGKWREILIDNGQSIENQNELKFVMSNKDTAATMAFKNILDKYPSLDRFEFSPMSGTIIENISSRISEWGGFSLIADYGHFGEKGDTFRAFKGHQLADPLKDLGETDLTADVNFKFLVDHLADSSPGKLLVNGPISQKVFLANMGIDFRLEMLLENCLSDAQRDYLLSGYRIMMDAQEMGDRVKFLAILPHLQCYPGQYLPAGFCELQ